MPLTYQQALAYIEDFGDPYLQAIANSSREAWGLDSTRDMLHRLGDPHLAYPVIHIAGTKGKGSTCALITQGLIEAGLKTGLYISPHLEDFRERMQINRELIAPQELADLVSVTAPIAEQVKGLNKFEFITALAFQYFARQNVDVAVIETGLGGRLDATNVVQPLLSVITNISIDHVQLLGDTLAEIAGEKAGIIKPGVPVVCAPQQPEVLAVFEAVAAERGCPLVVVGRDREVEVLQLDMQGGTLRFRGADGQPTDYRVGLPGRFQIENAAVALAALEEVRRAGLPVTNAAMAAGLANVRWPGRMEIVASHPLTIIDSAHNAHSAARLAEALSELVLSTEGAPAGVTLVFGCMADKDIHGMLAHLLPVTRRLVLTRIDHPRALPVEDLQAVAAGLLETAHDHGAARGEHTVIEQVGIPALDEALRHALAVTDPTGVICVTGSLALAGEARTIVKTLPGANGRRHAPAAPLLPASGAQREQA
ncbi:MAG: folylpolyglutamate synthase/dihydrofolate synthase family protein [Anaerolineae bacterium]